MNIDYTTYFNNWQNWDVFEPPFNGINGVYAFRLKQSFERLKGRSDVIYIGKADQNPNRERSGLYYRIMNYRQEKSGSGYRLEDIEKHFGGRSVIEYAYRQCDNPREVEKKLLESYYNQHLELPPLNRAG